MGQPWATPPANFADGMGRQAAALPREMPENMAAWAIRSRSSMLPVSFTSLGRVSMIRPMALRPIILV